MNHNPVSPLGPKQKASLLSALVLSLVLGLTASAVAQAVVATFSGQHTGNITSLAYSVDGSSIVTGGADGRVVTWDAVDEPGRMFHKWTNSLGYPREEDVGVFAVFSPDGGTVLSLAHVRTSLQKCEQGAGCYWQTYHVGSAHLLEALTLTPIHDFTDRLQVDWNPGNSVWFGHFLPSNELILFQYWGLADSWPASGPPYLIKRDYVPPDYAVKQYLNFFPIPTDASRDGTMLLGLNNYPGNVGIANSASLINLNTGEEIRKFGSETEHHTKPVNDCKLSPDAKSVVTVSADSTIRLWETATGRCLKVLPPRHNESVNAVSFSPEGQRIVTGSDDGRAIVWNLEKLFNSDVSGPAYLVLNHEAWGKVRHVAYSPLGNTVLTSVGNVAYLWGDLPTPVNRYELKLFLSQGGSVITTPLFGGDGKYAEGTKVTLSAYPSASYYFDRWSDIENATIGRNPTLDLIMDSTKNISVWFVKGAPAGRPMFNHPALTGTSVALSWTGAGTLDQAFSPLGPWSTAASQSNPQTVRAQGAMFYRLRQ